MAELRRATPSDAEGMARVHAESGRDAYRGFIPDAALDSPNRLEERAVIWRTVTARLAPKDLAAGEIEGAWVVETDAGQIVGLIHLDRCHDDDATACSAEITTLYVATEHQGEGWGIRLLDRARQHAVACGCDDLRLWTLEHNIRAHRFYEALGWQRDGGLRRTPATDYTAHEVRYRLRSQA